MKTYADIAGDGGSNIIGQVVSLKEQIKSNLSQIKHIIVIGSGKGGVGKSTLTMQLAAAFKNQGHSVGLLDADVNGPSLARMSGLHETPLIPGNKGLIVPKTKSGIGVISFGSLVPENEAVDFESVAQGDSHIWRATKEFSTLAQFLAYADWGKLDFFLIDLPPGAERVFQFAEFFGAEAKFILITIPSQVSQGVVGRSVAALKKTSNQLLGLIENMTGYYCADCKKVKPLFSTGSETSLDVPVLGRIPFDPRLADNCDHGITITDREESVVAAAIHETAIQIKSILAKP